jgi:hypothetical protein
MVIERNFLMKTNSAIRSGRLIAKIFAGARLIVFALVLIGLGDKAQAQWSTSGTSTTTTNNVGIGTTAPGDALEVNGNIRFTDNIMGSLIKRADVVFNLIKTSRSDDTQVGQFRTNGWGDFTVDRSFAVGYDLSNTPSGVGSLFVATSMGLNTTSPTSWGAFAVRTSATVNNKNVSASLSDGIHSTFDIRHPVNNVVDLSSENSALTFSTAPGSSTDGTERMRIDTSGNVGIGTTTPTGMLSITTVGGVSDSFSALYLNSTSSYTGMAINAPTGQDSFIELMNNGSRKAGITWTGSAGTPYLNMDAGGSAAIRLNPSGGNVGIGTTNPGDTLEVNGNIRFTDNILNSLLKRVDVVSNLIKTSRSDNTQVGQFRTNGWGDFTVDRSFGVGYDLTGTAFGPGNLFVSGNTGIGTNTVTSGYRLEVSGDLKLSGTGNINAMGTIEAGNIKAKYQDVAEWVPSSEQLSAGTVVVLDSTKSNQVTSSTTSYDTRVAGVVSEQPGIALGEKSEGKVLVATTGRVRVRVDATRGPIHIGDLLVTSDVSGMAMKSEPIMIGGRQIHAPGTLIGKALEPLQKGKGEILVLLSLQ